MAFTLFKEKPDSLRDRELPNSVAIGCDCGVHFLWQIHNGNLVRCPCRRHVTEEVDLTGAERLPTTLIMP